MQCNLHLATRTRSIFQTLSIENSPPQEVPSTTDPHQNKETTSPVTFGQWLLLFMTAGVVIAIDQFTKWIVVSTMHVGESVVFLELLEGIFDFTYTRNTGAAFGLGKSFGDVLLVIALVVSAAIVYYYRRVPDGWLLIRVALGLEMGGALGNAIDRITRGYVVDFFHLHGFPIFNVADSSIVVGVAILVVMLWWHDHQEAKAEEKRKQEAEADEAVAG